MSNERDGVFDDYEYGSSKSGQAVSNEVRRYNVVQRWLGHDHAVLEREYVEHGDSVDASAYDSLRAERDWLRGLLKDLAGFDDSGLYESEYDGRMYTHCLGCNYQGDVRRTHAETCPYEKARVELKVRKP